MVMLLNIQFQFVTELQHVLLLPWSKVLWHVQLRGEITVTGYV